MKTVIILSLIFVICILLVVMFSIMKTNSIISHQEERAEYYKRIEEEMKNGS